MPDVNEVECLMQMKLRWLNTIYKYEQIRRFVCEKSGQSNCIVYESVSS